jgi:hypothetical protein
MDGEAQSLRSRRQLGEQPALADSRFPFEQHGPEATAGDVAQELVEDPELGFPAMETVPS